jgi:hypothetical protein
MRFRGVINCSLTKQADNRNSIKVYFDTNILDYSFTLLQWEENKQDKKYTKSKKTNFERNLISLRYILEIGEEQWNMTFGTSKMTKEEVDRIRIESDRVYYQEKKPDLLFFYDTLRKIPSEQFGKDKQQNKSKTAEQQTFMEEVRKIVRDEDDVKHIVQFWKSKWDVFLTLDYQHILRKRKYLKRLGVCVESPLSLLHRVFHPEDHSCGKEDPRDLEMLIRTLHGSWEREPIISKPKTSEEY